MDPASLAAARRFVASLGLEVAKPDAPPTTRDLEFAVLSALSTLVRAQALLMTLQADRSRLVAQVGELRGRLRDAEGALRERRAHDAASNIGMPPR